jgi:hypothetical protein
MAVLYEKISKENELSLCVYDLKLDKETVLVSYPAEVFTKYYLHAYQYIWSWAFGGEDRRLKAEWIDNETISYLDFITREKIIIKVSGYTDEI